MKTVLKEVEVEKIDKTEAKNQVLVERAKSGNSRALSELCAFNQAYIKAVLMSKTRNNSVLSEDLTQDVLVKMSACIKQYSFNEYKFRSWLSKIIKSVFIDHIRFENARVDGRTNSVDFFGSSTQSGENSANSDVSFMGILTSRMSTRSVESEFISNETRENMVKLVHEGIKSLKNEKMRKAIELSFDDEMSYVDISNKINESLSNTKALINRAKAGILKYIVLNNQKLAGSSINNHVIYMSVVNNVNSKKISKSLGFKVSKVDSIIEEGLGNLYTNIFHENMELEEA